MNFGLAAGAVWDKLLEGFIKPLTANIQAAPNIMVRAETTLCEILCVNALPLAYYFKLEGRLYTWASKPTRTPAPLIRQKGFADPIESRYSPTDLTVTSFTSITRTLKNAP